jgi:hypothetical protein
MNITSLHLLVQRPGPLDFDSLRPRSVAKFGPRAAGFGDATHTAPPIIISRSMAEHDEVYDDARADRLADLLRGLARRIQELDQAGQLLRGAPELLRLMGDARSELFHYEVRSTYDTPEVADSRRIVEDAQRPDLFTNDDSEDDEPWRRRQE